MGSKPRWVTFLVNVFGFGSESIFKICVCSCNWWLKRKFVKQPIFFFFNSHILGGCVLVGWHCPVQIVELYINWRSMDGFFLDLRQCERRFPCHTNVTHIFTYTCSPANSLNQSDTLHCRVLDTQLRFRRWQVCVSKIFLTWWPRDRYLWTFWLHRLLRWMTQVERPLLYIPPSTKHCQLANWPTSLGQRGERETSLDNQVFECRMQTSAYL